MTIGLVFLSVLMAIIVGWLFRQTINVQPWEAQAVPAGLVHAPGRRPVAKAALWVFLAVVASLFTLFVSAYAMRLSFGDWAPLPQPRLLTINTVVLTGASLAMAWTVRAARRGQPVQVRQGLWLSGLFTFGFLVGQLVVWKQLSDAGFYLTSSAAASFFYLLTAAHGLHVLGGMVAWVRASLRARRVADIGRVRLAVELCATYWHFLLAVWLVLYALLTSNDFGLAICTAPS